MSCVRDPSALARETGAGVRWAIGPGVRMGMACGRKGALADPGGLDTRSDGGGAIEGGLGCARGAVAGVTP